MSFEKATIIISATDETKSLIETVETIFSTCCCSDIDLILIVIPENAGSGCIAAIDFLNKKYPDKIKKLVQWYPYIGGAMRSSIEATTSSHIMFLSADIPTSLECIPIMIEKAKKTPDTIIKVSRWLKKNSFHSYSNSRKFFNHLAQKFLKLLFCSELTDYTCPVLIAKTEIYKGIRFKEFNFPCLLEAVLIPLKMGFKFEEIPTKCYSRTEGKSKNSVLQTTLYLRTAFRVRFSPKEKIYKIR